MNNFSQAGEILEFIKQAKNILLTSHTSPDLDSIGSTLAFYNMLQVLGKNDAAVVLSDTVNKNFSYLPGYKEIQTQDLKEFDFSPFDLFITLDCAELRRTIHHLHPLELPKNLKVINIDHHKTNSLFGFINLVEDLGSTSELLFSLFKQWGVEINQNIAQCLLTGVVGDTGSFRYEPSTTPETFAVAAELMRKGASVNLISLHFDRNLEFEVVSFWGKVIQKMKIIKEKNLTYLFAGMSYEEIKAAGGPEYNEGTTDLFFGRIAKTDFGVFIVEEEKGVIKGSFRARSDIDISRIAVLLGGGGHKSAAGFKFDLGKLTFEQGVEKIHNVICKVTKDD